MKLLISGTIIIFAAGIWAALPLLKQTTAEPRLPSPRVAVSSPKPTLTPSPSSAVKPLPTTHVIPIRTHVFQTFNNCGPASLSMALSYYDIAVTQAEIGNQLRPYQIPGGDNDDKSVTLAELASFAEKHNLVAFHRPNGNIELLKKFIAADFPVITRTWLKPNEDIGHYRVVRGYDDTTGELIQDDSLQNKDLRYTYENFLTLWQAFNYEYLVLVPQNQVELAHSILGAQVDEATAWELALTTAQTEGAQQPANVYFVFNQSVAQYHLGNYQESVKLFESVQAKLPMRMLWYQIEPIRAYQQLGNFTKVMQITDTILNNHNRAFSELYIIRGEMYLSQGNREAARAEFEKAIQYNRNLKRAQELLTQI